MTSFKVALRGRAQISNCTITYDYDELAALTKATRDGDVRSYGRIVELTRSSVEAAARVIVHNRSGSRAPSHDAVRHR